MILANGLPPSTSRLRRLHETQASEPGTCVANAAESTPLATDSSTGSHKDDETHCDVKPASDSGGRGDEQAKFNRDIRMMHHLSYSNSEQQAVADAKGYLKVGKFADDSWAHVQETCNAMSVAITKELHDSVCPSLCMS